MKFFKCAKDGGPESTVTGYWLFEIKRFASVALLRFDDGSRDVYHSHAFASLNWVLKGCVLEHTQADVRPHRPSFWPILTRRSTFHKVVSDGTTWVLSLRGPWSKRWLEYDPKTRTETTLEQGRKVVAQRPMP